MVQVKIWLFGSNNQFYFLKYGRSFAQKFHRSPSAVFHLQMQFKEVAGDGKENTLPITHHPSERSGTFHQIF
jgi:hypothetical protein